MTNPWQKVAHALTYVSGPNIYEWKRSAENWILSIPAPSALNKTVYEDFEEEFVESWTDTNESHCTTVALDKLQIKDEKVNEYITTFAECYDLSLFLLIYLLFCLSLCAAPCLALFAFLCACFIAYLCVVLGHILHDT